MENLDKEIQNNEAAFISDPIFDNASKFIDDPVQDNASKFLGDNINFKLGSFISKLSESVTSSVSEGTDIDIDKIIYYAQQIELMA